MPSENTDPETGWGQDDAPIGDISEEADEIQSQLSPSHQRSRPPLQLVVSATTTQAAHRRVDSGSEWSEDLLHEDLRGYADGVLPHSYADSEYGVEIRPDDTRNKGDRNRRHQRGRSESHNKDDSSLSDSVDRVVIVISQ